MTPTDRTRAAEPPLWMTDWSDVEDRRFRDALAVSGEDARVLRVRRYRRSENRLAYRMRSYPTYVELAARSRFASGGSAAHVVAWQPLAGVAASLIPGGDGQRRVLVNPLLDPDAPGLLRQMMVEGTNRSHRAGFLVRSAVDAAVAIGVHRDVAEFVPFGVHARTDVHTPTTGEFFLAIGRELRDWETLARAAAATGKEVLVVGPRALPSGTDGLRLVQTSSRDETFELMARAAAVVVPLVASRRQAGLLVMLDAFSAGRAVIATRNPGTVDYLTSDRGRLVEPADPGGLGAAMVELSDLSVADDLGANALEAARGDLALHRFIRDMHGLARA